MGLLASACRPEFTGPYDCNPGYASCVSPEQNLCETNTRNDALHCGDLPAGESCADAGTLTQCLLGASCVDGGCGAMATELAALTTTSQSLVVNASGVFWSDANAVYWLPASGGAQTTVASNLTSCGQTAVFAVDSTSVYYFSNGFNCGNTNCAGLVQAPLSGVPQGGSPTVLVPAPTTGNSNLCANALELSPDGTALYWLTNAQSGGGPNMLTLAKVTVGGGTPSTVVGTVPNPNGAESSRLVVTPNAAIFVVSQSNGPASFEVFPASGGSATVLALPQGFPGFSQFTADADNIYVVGSSCPCNNGNNNGNGNGSGVSYAGPPVGTVGKIPLDGTAGTLLAHFDGQTGDIALDPADSYVYWSTDTAAWKVPVTGGSSIPVAGNLTRGTAGMLCAGCGGSSYVASPIAIGVDTRHVYLADDAISVNALLEVPK